MVPGRNHGNITVWSNSRVTQASPFWYSALSAMVHQAWSAPCCVSFYGLHRHKCFLPSLKPHSFLYVSCVSWISACMLLMPKIHHLAQISSSLPCWCLQIYFIFLFFRNCSVTGCLGTVTSPSCLPSEWVHVGTWQSSVDYCFVPNLCFWNVFMKHLSI